MNCEDIKFGTYDCAYNIMLPYLVQDPLKPNGDKETYIVSVDKCLLPEILKLWEMGIKTSGCCCGHGRENLSFIGVMPEYIQKMKELGYKVRFNPCRPGDEDSFIPKTKLNYGSINKGFNWWDERNKSDCNTCVYKGNRCFCPSGSKCSAYKKKEKSTVFRKNLE